MRNVLGCFLCPSLPIFTGTLIWKGFSATTKALGGHCLFWLPLSGSPGEGNQLLPCLPYAEILGSVQKAVKSCKIWMILLGTYWTEVIQLFSWFLGDKGEQHGQGMTHSINFEEEMSQVEPFSTGDFPFSWRTISKEKYKVQKGRCKPRWSRKGKKKT